VIRRGRIPRALPPPWQVGSASHAPRSSTKAQECLGGAGYVEESILPRLYRQAPLNSIWEGSGNIQCLDVLRALSKEPETREAHFSPSCLSVRANIPTSTRKTAGSPRLDDKTTLELRSRHIVERMGARAAGRNSPFERATQKSSARFARRGWRGIRLVFGTLRRMPPMRGLVERRCECGLICVGRRGARD